MDSLLRYVLLVFLFLELRDARRIERARQTAKTKPLSLLEAERVFNRKLSEAFEAAAAREAGLQSRRPSNDTGSSGESIGNDSDEAQKKREKAFQEEQMKRNLKGMIPTVQAYICLQLSIDLSFLVPGLTVDFGVLGGVRRDFASKCWGVTAEVSLGFSWGFEVYGYGLGLGAAVTGSLDLSEMPENAVTRDHITRSWHFSPEGSDPSRCHTSAFWTLALTFIENEYVRAYNSPEVRTNLTRITETPEYIETRMEYTKAYGTLVNGNFKLKKLTRPPLIRNFRRLGSGLSRTLGSKTSLNTSSADKILQRRSKDIDEYFAPPINVTRRSNHTYSLDDWDIAELRKRTREKDQDSSSYLNLDNLANEVGYWRRPKVDAMRGAYGENLVKPAYAMTRAMWNFVTLLPAYSDQVLDRLLDSSGDWKGFDSELQFASFENKNLKRMKETDGRHLARWPSMVDFERIKSDTEETLPGISYKKSEKDDRVLNFAKVVRVSERASDPSFWKEVAISASNLLIRVVADVKALFSASLANNPSWDGSCESLAASFYVGDDIERDILIQHAWISKRAQPKHRILFKSSQRAREYRTLKGTPRLHVCEKMKRGDECKRGENDLSVLYPHLWCVLAEKGQDASPDAAKDVEDIEIALTQACVTVGNEEVELKDGDEIRMGYNVYNDGKRIGMLVGPQTVSNLEWTGDAEADRLAAKEKGFKVRVKVMEHRPDCERVVLPKSFRRIFPNFVTLVQEMVARMEEILFRINMCLQEAHNVYTITRTFPDKDAWRTEPRQCLTKEENAIYTKEKASDAIRLVRWFLFQLGAEDPRTCTSCKYDLETLPLARYELDAIRDSKNHFAPAANSMALDFVSAFGYGPTEVVYKSFPNVVDLLDDPSKARHGPVDLYLLEGYMWLQFLSIRDELFAAADPHSRLVRKLESKLLRPPIEYTTGLTVTAQLSGNGFCTPNSAPIVVARHASTTRQSWSNTERHEICWIGRMRPGSFFIQVARCRGSMDGVAEDPESYIDWRIRFQSMLIGGDIFSAPEAGLFGSALTSTDSALSVALTSAAALGGGFLSYEMLDKLAPRIMENPVVGSIMMLSGATVPAFSVLMASAAVITSHTFHGACERFLKHMAANGIVQAPGSNPFGFQLSPILVVHGTVIHRVREQSLVRGFQDFGRTAIQKRQRRVSMHLENWNIASLTLPVFGASKLNIVGRFEFDFDLTPWYEWVRNKELQTENELRISTCKKCLSESNEAFCDWRVPLGSEWKPERDQCVPNTPEEEAECTNPIGITDLNGRDLLAVWHAPTNVSTCDTITYVRANQEIRASRTMHQFFRRH